MDAVRHPGRILLEDFLERSEISQNALARLMQVSPRRVNEIVLGKRSITADTALRLSDALGMSGRFWMALQAEYDLDRAARCVPRGGNPDRAERANIQRGDAKCGYGVPQYGEGSPFEIRKRHP